MKTARDKYRDRITEIAARYIEVTNRRLDQAKRPEEQLNIVCGKLHSSIYRSAAAYSETFRKATEILG